MISPDAIPVLPRGVRLHFDTVRDTWVLLAPERVLALDAVGHAVLSEVDGKRSLGEITEDLAQRYNAPAERIVADSTDFLTALCDRRFLEVTS